MDVNLRWPSYTTKNGICINAKCEEVFDDFLYCEYTHKVQLILTSPPFPLTRAKKYGNLTGEQYLDWLCNIGNCLKPLLTDTGSIVIEIGNSWNLGEATFSTLPLETLIEFKKRCNLYLCQQFVYYNPARLPSPIEWVNKKKIRVKDAFTTIWWLSTTPNPYADNRNVRTAYSKQMLKLLQKGTYNSGKRPSEHKISTSGFLKDNGGAIPSNVIIASNTSSKDDYLVKCKENGLQIHPARMTPAIPEFFINFLTQPKDMVLDCFAGSNTTGYVAERLNRQWISIEAQKEYFEGSLYRFLEVSRNDAK